jgi:hypothetical protein
MMRQKTCRGVSLAIKILWIFPLRVDIEQRTKGIWSLDGAPPFLNGPLEVKNQSYFYALNLIRLTYCSNYSTHLL